MSHISTHFRYEITAITEDLNFSFASPPRSPQTRGLQPLSSTKLVIFCQCSAAKADFQETSQFAVSYFETTPPLGQPEFTPVVLDALQPSELSAELHATGICHVNFSCMKGRLPAKFPCVLGHEGRKRLTIL